MIVMARTCPRSNWARGHCCDWVWGLLALSGYIAVLGQQLVFFGEDVSMRVSPCGRQFRHLGPPRIRLPRSYVLERREGVGLPDGWVGIFFILWDGDLRRGQLFDATERLLQLGV